MADKIKVVLADGRTFERNNGSWWRVVYPSSYGTDRNEYVCLTDDGDESQVLLDSLVAEVERLTQKCVDHEKSTDVEADYYNRLPEYMAGIMEGAHVRIVRRVKE